MSDVEINYSNDIAVTILNGSGVTVTLTSQGPAGPQGEIGDVTPAAVAARDAAQTAATAAQTSAGKADTSATAADSSAKAASTSATNAKASETNSKTSESNAKTSETNAKTSETNSKTSETNAKASETAAGQSKTDAQAANTAAQQAKTDAATDAANAAIDADDADHSATAAAASEAAAATSASNAATSEGNAKTSETNAKASETNAKTSEDNAKTSETNAKASQTGAATAVTNAQIAEGAAETAQTDAEQARDAAAAAKTAAETARDRSFESRDNAQASRDAAKTSEDNAAGSASSAADAAAAAQAAADSIHAIDMTVYALKDSPVLEGTPTTPTAAEGDNSKTIANTEFVQRAIDGLAGGSGDGLQSIAGLSAAINNDPDYHTTVDNQLATKAPKNSPDLTGTPTAPTAAPGTNSTQVATTGYVDAAVAAVVDSAPETLNTLREIAEKLADDEDTATALANEIATKADAAVTASALAARYTKQEADVLLANKAALQHTHATGDINGLQAMLDAAIQSAIDNMPPADGVPVGAVIFRPNGSDAPAGYLPAEAVAFDKLIYPDLYAFLGVAVTPDFRDRVPRGAGTLAGAAGTTQEDAFQGHWHQLGNSSGTVSTARGTVDGSQSFKADQATATGADVQVAIGAITDGVNGVPRKASETRVKAVIGRFFIKAYATIVDSPTLDMQALAAKVDEILAINGGIPIGTVIDMYGDGTTAPAGFIRFTAGQAVTAAYPLLREYGLNNGWSKNVAGDPVMPDTTSGAFKRGWSADQTTDAGRAFGTVQQDAFQGHRHANSGLFAQAGATYNVSAGRNEGAISTGGDPTTDGSHGAVRTASETRPVNFTVTYWIKAYGTIESLETSQLQALSDKVDEILTENSGVPIGTVIDIYGNGATPPGGFIRFTANTPVTNIYPQLRAFGLANGWAVNGNGDPVMPANTEGAFKRGWSANNALDPGRLFGSTQLSQNLAHTHSVTDPGHIHGVTDPGHSHSVTDPGHSHPITSGNAAVGTTPGIAPAYQSATNNTMSNTIAIAKTGIAIQSATTGITIQSAKTGITIQSDGGTEARPVNFTVTYWIKAYGVMQSADDIAVADVVAKLNLIQTQLPLLRPRLKNWLMNGCFNIQQRGSSQTTSSYGSDDRWWNGHAGSTKTHSLVLFPDLSQTDVPGNPVFFSRTVVNSVAGAGNYVSKLQKIWKVTSLAGKSATLTFWAKADAARKIAVCFAQNFGPSGSAQNNMPATIVQLTTGWAKYTVPVTFPSISGKVVDWTGSSNHIWVQFFFEAGATIAASVPGLSALGQQSGTFDLARISLNEGDTTSLNDPYDDINDAEELRNCLFYYSKIQASLTSGYSVSGNFIYLDLAIAMRVAPTVTFGNISSSNASNLAVNSATSSNIRTQITAASTALCYVISDIFCDAEL